MIVIVGDVHFKHTQPYLKKIKEFFDDLINKYPEAILIQTGDFFDTSSPHSEAVVDTALEYLLKFKEVHIVSGNHELSNRVGNPLIPLNRFNSIHIYTKPEQVIIENKSFLMLPYLYNVKSMKEQYEDMYGKYDYVVSHIAYPGTNFGAPDEINLSNIEAKAYFYGHIHEPLDKPNNHFIVGVPVSTRHGEQNWKKRIVIIDNDIKFEYLKNYLDFETVNFNDEPISKDSILNIVNAPSVKSVIERYKGYHIRLTGILLTGEEDNKVTYNQQKEFLNFSLEKNFQEFSESLEIRSPVQSKILELFQKIP